MVMTRGGNMYFSGSLIFSFSLYAIIFVLLYRKKPQELFDSTTAAVKYPHKK
ncbi:hypothetical protein [Paraflavitalea speifideaquila]|uniref:hypothetical protein n=1 Tax=Paraflavitalea speifideaquila TaxID=3076558 RepID=UPI0028E37E98|nr:hypothetical protein [Paraflavitalea speifideiaquila]